MNRMPPLCRRERSLPSAFPRLARRARGRRRIPPIHCPFAERCREGRHRHDLMQTMRQRIAASPVFSFFASVRKFGAPRNNRKQMFSVGAATTFGLCVSVAWIFSSSQGSVDLFRQAAVGIKCIAFFILGDAFVHSAGDRFGDGVVTLGVVPSFPSNDACALIEIYEFYCASIFSGFGALRKCLFFRFFLRRLSAGSSEGACGFIHGDCSPSVGPGRIRFCRGANASFPAIAFLQYAAWWA